MLWIVAPAAVVAFVGSSPTAPTINYNRGAFGYGINYPFTNHPGEEPGLGFKYIRRIRIIGNPAVSKAAVHIWA